MKGIVILIVVLAILGIWWAKRTPEPVSTFQPEAASAESANGINLNADVNGSVDTDPAENEDKG